MVAAAFSNIPVINAGDGGHQHPTQTLTDLLTISSLKGRLNDLTIGLCGDLKFGRTVHSLINALVRYENIRFIFISPEELKVPDYIIEMLKENNIAPAEVRQIVFTGQAESLVVLDAEGRTLRNAISWMDERSVEECAEVEKRFTAKEIAQMHAEGETLAMTGYGVLHIDPACDREQLYAVVESIRVRGKVIAPADVKAHYGVK